MNPLFTTISPLPDEDFQFYCYNAPEDKNNHYAGRDAIELNVTSHSICYANSAESDPEVAFVSLPTTSEITDELQLEFD